LCSHVVVPPHAPTVAYASPCKPQIMLWLSLSPSLVPFTTIYTVEVPIFHIFPN
jgi:hypothetical protein